MKKLTDSLLVLFLLMYCSLSYSASKSHIFKFNLESETKITVDMVQYIVKELNKDKANYLAQYKKYSYPDKNIKVNYYCDSLKASNLTKEHKDEFNFKRSQKYMNLHNIPGGTKRVFFWHKPLLSYKEVTQKVPSLIDSRIHLPPMLNTQCRFDLNFNASANSLEVKFEHWNVGWGEADKRFLSRKKKLSEKIVKLLEKKYFSQFKLTEHIE